MSTQGVVGAPFTFQVLFTDDLNVPIVVDSPTLLIFHFDSEGEKEELLAEVAMDLVVGDTGRYKYTYTISDALIPGDTMYGQMRGVNPDTDLAILVEQEVYLTINPILTSNTGGLRAQFVKGG